MSLFPALTHPFAAGFLPTPDLTAAAFGLYLRADADPGLSVGWARGLRCVQSFKPAYDRLHRQGVAVAPTLEEATRGSEGGAGVILLALTKHKLESQALVAQAWRALKPGGQLICAGAIDAGGAALSRAAVKLLPDVTVWSKHHCKILRIPRAVDAVEPPELAAWISAGARQIAPATGFWSHPGLYNWNKIDVGSALLAELLPTTAVGRAADFGAGWGYLSCALLARSQGVDALDLYEAEALAEPCATANLARQSAAETTNALVPRFIWRDLAAAPPVGAGYDLVMMNPPFHEGKSADPALGRSFIAAAAAALAPGGRLLMVANRHLPYEEAVDALLRRRRVLAERDGFKVLEAWR